MPPPSDAPTRRLKGINANYRARSRWRSLDRALADERQPVAPVSRSCSGSRSHGGDRGDRRDWNQRQGEPGRARGESVCASAEPGIARIDREPVIGEGAIRRFLEWRAFPYAVRNHLRRSPACRREIGQPAHELFGAFTHAHLRLPSQKGGRGNRPVACKCRGPFIAPQLFDPACIDRRERIRYAPALRSAIPQISASGMSRGRALETGAGGGVRPARRGPVRRRRERRIRPAGSTRRPVLRSRRRARDTRARVSSCAR